MVYYMCVFKCQTAPLWAITMCQLKLKTFKKSCLESLKDIKSSIVIKVTKCPNVECTSNKLQEVSAV